MRAQHRIAILKRHQSNQKQQTNNEQEHLTRRQKPQKRKVEFSPHAKSIRRYLNTKVFLFKKWGQHTNIGFSTSQIVTTGDTKEGRSPDPCMTHPCMCSPFWGEEVGIIRRPGKIQATRFKSRPNFEGMLFSQVADDHAGPLADRLRIVGHELGDLR